MADCKIMPDCDFYHDRIEALPDKSEFMKMIFCHRSPEKCERLQWIESNDGKTVPNNIFPVNTSNNS
ncbi:hypothetical protein ACFLZI_01400 [Nitrospirota bacterium]